MPSDRCGERVAQSCGRPRQLLGQHARLADHRHEVRVAVPARHHVQMQMVEHARAGGLAEIQPHVEAVRMIDRGQRLLGALRERHELRELRIGEIRQPADMPVRHDHEMAVVVRILVQQDERPLPAMNDERLGVEVRQRVTENARRRHDARLSHVGQPPRGPEPLHRTRVQEGPVL